MNKTKALKIGACCLAGALLCGALVYFNFVEKEPDTGAMKYDKCPDFTIAKYEVSGEQFILSDEKFTLSECEDKVVVINFWATWCQPCKEEIPYFNQLQEKYDEQVEVVIINNGDAGSAQKMLDTALNKVDDDVQSSYQKYYKNWVDYSCTFAWSKDTKSLFRVGDGLPVTIIVDKAGTIQYISESSMHYDELEEEVLKYL